MSEWLQRADVEKLMGVHLDAALKLRATARQLKLIAGGRSISSVYRDAKPADVAAQFIAAAAAWREQGKAFVERQREANRLRLEWEAKCRAAMSALAERFPGLKVSDDGLRATLNGSGRFYLGIQPNSAGSVESFDVYTDTTVTKGELARLLKVLADV